MELGGRALPVLPAEDKLWLKPYVDLQAYEDPAQGALDFTQELDPTWLIVDTVIGEGKPRGSLCHGPLIECPGAAPASYTICFCGDGVSDKDH